MDPLIALLLVQDGLTTGAVYALLALVLVMVFSVTRVILVPQGEIVTYAAFTLASLQAGRLPGTAWVLLGGGLVAAGLELLAYARRDRARARLLAAAAYALGPALVLGLAAVLAPHAASPAVSVPLTLLVVAPLGPIGYRAVFQPLVGASVLVLLIVAVALHIALAGLGLLFFGAEGVRTQPLLDVQFAAGDVPVSGQALFTVGATAVLIVALGLFFGFTLRGKALRATAMNRAGARLVGISPAASGQLAFALAALIGAVSGILASSLTTIYYDTGFLIGLKGFVAAIVGGLGSYPLAAAGALAIGLFESFSSFWASAFKDSIVFELILPILFWRNLSAHGTAEEDEE